MGLVVFCYLIIILQWYRSSGQITPVPTRRDFVKLEISDKYLKGARWELSSKAKPLNVYHTVELVDISSIKDSNAEYRLDLNLKQKWVEDELSLPEGLFLPGIDPPNSHVTVDADVLDDLWAPDPYIPNARDTVTEGLVKPHSSVRIYINNTIIYTVTMHVILGCPMNFQWYPCDIQFCKFHLESFSYPIDQVVYVWENTSEPIVLPKNFRLRRYYLQTPLLYTEESETRFGTNDTFSRITVHFVFQRQIGHHLIQVYMPTFLIVALSWFSFWLGFDAIPGRVSLLVTCMLTLVTIYGNLKADLPPVSYIKMLDVWMAGCLGFIFAAMSEFIIAKYIQHSYNTNKAAKKNDTSNPDNKIAEVNQVNKMEKIGTIVHHPYSEFYRNTPNISNSMNQFRHRNAWEISDRDLAREYQLRNDEYSREYFEIMKRLDKNRKLQKEHEKIKNLETPIPRWEYIDKVSRVCFPLAFFCFCCVYWPFLLIGSSVWQGDVIRH